MSKDRGQLADFALLFVRLRPNIKWIALVSAAVALVVGIYAAVTYKPSYVSETIAIVRPQQMLLTQAQENGEPGTGTTGSLLPQPLDVTDYVLFLQSEGMLASVAQAYNNYHARGGQNPVSVAQLRRMMAPSSRLEIKTPYTVEYYPTIEMRVSAPSPDKAYDLALLWVDAAKGWAETITFSAKEETATYLENETQEQRDSLTDLANTLNATKDESNELLESLKTERFLVEQEYESQTIQMLQEAADAWDARIAAAEAEFALPLAETALEAQKSILAGMQLAHARKTQDLEAAKASIRELAAQLDAEYLLALLEDIPLTSWQIALSEPAASIEPVPVPPSDTDKLREKEADKRAARRIERDEERREEVLDLLKSYTAATDPDMEKRQQHKIEQILKNLQEDTLEERERERKRRAAQAARVDTPQVQKDDLPPTITPEERQRIETFRIDASGGNPVAVLLQRDLSEAKLLLASAPLELEGLQADIEAMREAIATLEADYLAKRKALIMMDRAKESEIQKLETEREYGLEREQRITEMMIDNLSRERATMEEVLQRDFSTEVQVFTNLAESYLQAELAVANTIDEFQVVSPPTYPETPSQMMYAVYGTAAFAICFSVLFVAAAFLVVLRSIVSNIQVSEISSGS